MFRSWAFWRARVIELTVALGLAAGMISLSQQVGQREKELLPPSAWFEVYEVFVPDHEASSNPDMIYDRAIHEAFDAFWIVEVQRQAKNGLWSNACSGSGINEYSTDEIIEDNVVTWEWFLGRPCAVAPGRYRLRVSYTMTRPGWPTKKLFTTSNMFTIS